MKPSTEKYDPVEQDSEPDLSVSGEFDHMRRQSIWPSSSLYRVVFFGTFVLCALTTVLNCVFIFHSWKHNATTSTDSGLSKFANLESFTTPMPLTHEEKYVDEANLTTTEAAWAEMRGDEGVVALSDDYTDSMHIPRGYRYPWDMSKGVYLLQGYHNLHCLRTIFRSIMAYHHKTPQPIALIHILHCLDELRMDVHCNADDTPRYASIAPSGTGIGQVKMCRDWSQLQKWADERSACFRHEDEKPGPMLERFKHCRDGQRPWEHVKGKGHGHGHGGQ